MQSNRIQRCALYQIFCMAGDAEITLLESNFRWACLHSKLQARPTILVPEINKIRRCAHGFSSRNTEPYFGNRSSASFFSKSQFPSLLPSPGWFCTPKLSSLRRQKWKSFSYGDPDAHSPNIHTLLFCFPFTPKSC